jgi:hypothetical protein
MQFSLKRLACLIALLACCLTQAQASEAAVDLQRIPGGGIQPQVVVQDGVLHLIYLAGDPKASDVYYVRSEDWGRSFSQPKRVNSQIGSATAAGSIRGAQLAVGRGGRVHIAWNGSSSALPRGPLNPATPADSPHNGAPMLYARMDDQGEFEAQRNLITRTFGLDGGGTIAADVRGQVYVAWHASTAGAVRGEAGRRVWLARSSDEGRVFAAERAVSDEGTGACACCGMRLFAAADGDLLALYRSARDTVHRDIYLLASHDRGETFSSRMIHPWEIGACPMSSMFFVENPTNLLAAWETEKQVFFAQIDPKTLATSTPIAPAGGELHKYPVLAQNEAGLTLLVWSDAGGWAKPGRLRWNLIDSDGKVVRAPGGEAPELPLWSFAAVFSRPGGGFTVLY